MPGNDHPEGRLTSTGADSPELRQMSRRSLLGAAGVGAAGLAVGTFGGLGAAQAAPTRTPAAKKPVPAKPASTHTQSEPGERADADAHIVIHVHPERSGELDVYHGTSHVRVHDPDLAARLRQTTR
jgi:hypothetical protein